MQQTLPPPFIRQMQALLGPEWPGLETALKSPPPVSIRLNPNKKGATVTKARVQDFSSSIHQTPIPWHPQGFYLSERPVFTLDPTLHAGAYYVQEASSMFLYEALRQTVDWSKPLRALDLCAAPGGKTTLIADMLHEGQSGLLVSNETIRARTAPLRENLERWGNPHVAVTSAEVEDFAALEDWFDLVLVDAPCSGEGMFRKDPDAMREWSLPHVEFCAGRQKRILASAVAALAPGGVLAFSTCTYNAQENDENAVWLSKTFDLERLTLDIPESWGIMATAGGGYQFYPHRLQGEGFFLAVFRKKMGVSKKHSPASGYKSIKPLSKSLAPKVAEWLTPGKEARFFEAPSGEILALPAALESDFLLLDRFIKTKWFGTAMGELKGKDFVPSHALALSQWAAAGLPAVDLDRDHALRYLKKETFDLSAGSPQGWTLARYAGLNLGWLKILPNRLNNYLPQERRIRMAI